ncbi:hypothetical protein J437_LFUL017995 [Ladona fulva]|uniref:Uncharacterized protein n=1 Tax=Ladona fulva TaxID=123851 RepID=A0A8K0PC70_LADFU|nr:hypothetical protein J437_LFUL017995 [Ladona fulva]
MAFPYMEDISGTDDIFADSSTETVKENVTHECFSVDELPTDDGFICGFKSSCKETASSSANAAHGSVVAIRIIEDYYNCNFKAVLILEDTMLIELLIE